MSKNKMRIATIIWKDGFGGAERSICDLAAALDRSCFEMRFFYLNGGPGFFADKIKQIGFETKFLGWRNGFDIAGRIRLLQKLKEFNPHVIHDHIIPLLTRSFLKIFLRKPTLYTEHGVALQRSLGLGERWRRYIEKFDFRFCDYIAANSAASAIALKSTYQIPYQKIGTVHLGINLDQFNPSFSQQPIKDFLTIGYVGRILNAHKGVDYLPFVARNLKKKYGEIRFKFIVAGDGPDREKVEQLCREVDVYGHFTFLGWIRDVKCFLQQIDILLVPSRFEPLGLTAIEALAMNVPVVAFDVHGLREILGDCPAGFLVKPGDTESMAEIVYFLCNNHMQIGSKGREFVAQRFSNNKMARAYENIYRHLNKSY
ncbi:MAG: glycosyltransferase family 4 protein [Desulfamplus sp.]|nr:glycosyltransferase family 4 protein [Desulfamplus sp.]